MSMMSGPTSYAEIVEGVRATLARYAQALDDGRTEDVIATFCPDGACEIPGMGTHEGTEALRLAYTKWAPRRPQRHLVLNTLVTHWTDEEVQATSDVVFLLMGKSGWSVQLVGRYHDVLHQADGVWRFHRRTAEFVESGE
jgi:SnoaL-like domain